MLTLYVKTGCPFCEAVLHKIDELELTDRVTLKNIAEPGVADELIEKGGKRQEPFLDDQERGEQLYESDKIMDYLDTHYGAGEEQPA